ncbi:Protein indeterminate-domain 2 [Striga hermonthica]|uniref:Protein indeterminate-domain 2 n=1 Tax=Striga hermonthica TaxID=68872 RepID=A0A9N7RER6_STRHE|nr:Protein indeterminate-domain 2 [Striga hermonthica]
MSNVTGDHDDYDQESFSSGEVVRKHDNRQLRNESTNNNICSTFHQQLQPLKKKRNLPGTPDPTAEVIALSPKTLMATNRFVCEICNKGFQRDQNLQLHKRGHNLPWKLRQRTTNEVKRRVFVCPEPTCVHNDPSRALGDLTGIKKHYSRKHGEKKWKCEKCSKKYAVQSDWKAHCKTCGTREYKCDCGAVFSRRDSFIAHRAFCDALAQENSKARQGIIMGSTAQDVEAQMTDFMPISTNAYTSIGVTQFNSPFKPMHVARMLLATSSSGTVFGSSPLSIPTTSSGLQLSANPGTSSYNFHPDDKLSQMFGPTMPATALLQEAAKMGATTSNTMHSPMEIMQGTLDSIMAGPDLLSGPGPTTNTQTFDKFLQMNTEDTVARPFVCGTIFIGDQNPVAGLLKDVVEAQEKCNNMMGGTPPSLGGNAMATVDFLGLGGSGLHDLLIDGQLGPENMNQRPMQADTSDQQLSHPREEFNSVRDIVL